MISACLVALSCGPETQERPREPRAGARSAAIERSAQPLPSSAFEDAASAASASGSTARPAIQERFTTRRIGAQSSADGPPRFHGTPVDLDLKAASVHDVFRLLADVGKVNIVVDGAITGTVTMRLRQVPWEQALDAIAHARGLSYERQGNILFVTIAKPPPASDRK